MAALDNNPKPIADETAGEPSRNIGTNESAKLIHTADQLLGGGFERIITERSNITDGIPKFDTGFIPAITEGRPTAINPTGVGGSASQDESGEGASEGVSGGE